MIKLFQTFEDLEFVEVSNEVIDGLELDAVLLADVELRNGKSIRVTKDDEDGEIVYMAVLFDGPHVIHYCVAETEKELNKWMIEQQKKNPKN